MRRLITYLAGLVLAALVAAPAAPAASSLQLQISPSPAKVTLPVTVTASGNAQTTSWLEVFYDSSGLACAATDSAQGSRSGSFPLKWTYNLSGAFSEQGTFTPDAPPIAYRLCGYLYADGKVSTDPPDVLTTTTFTPVIPASTLGLSFTPAAPKAGDTVTVTAAGDAGLDATLWWYAEPNASDCGVTRGDEAARLAAESIGVRFPSLGAYSMQGQFAPSAAGTYRLCGYVYYEFDNDESQAPRAFATTTVPVAAATTPVVTPVVTPVLTPPSSPLPSLPGLSDPTGVLKLKPAGGKAKSCGGGCMSRTRTAGPFSFALKVRVAGSKVIATGTVRDTKKSPQAGKAGKVCLSRYAPKFKQTCRKVTWMAGLKVTLTGSIAKPSKVNKSARPGFGLSAFVGDLAVPGTSAIYLKSAGGSIVPDTNESACLASARAHAAC